MQSMYTPQSDANRPREYRVQSAIVLPTDTPSWLLFDELKVGNRVVVVFTIIGFNGSHNVENKHNKATNTYDRYY